MTIIPLTKNPTTGKMNHVKVLLTEERIAERVSSLAEEVVREYGSQAEPILLIAMLKGSFVFAADLARALSKAGLEVEIDFLGLSSYGTNRESSGEVKVTSDISAQVQDRHVLLVDDILESGLSLTCAIGMMCERNAASVRSAVLMEKPGKRRVKIDANFVGFEIEDRFVIGYGLDDAGKYRELPYVGVVEE